MKQQKAMKPKEYRVSPRNPNLPFTAKYDKKTRKEIKTYIRNEWRSCGTSFKNRTAFVHYVVERLNALGCKAPDGGAMNYACAWNQVKRAVGKVRLTKNAPRKAPKPLVAAPVSSTLRVVLKDTSLSPELRLNIVERLLEAGITA